MIGIATAVVAVLVIGLVLVLMLLLRRWTLDEIQTEAWLHSPTTHTLAYVVPDGQDPAVLIGALGGAGFVSRAEMEGGEEELLVACEDTDRDRVRHILEEASPRPEGARTSVGHVRFADET